MTTDTITGLLTQLPNFAGFIFGLYLLYNLARDLTKQNTYLIGIIANRQNCDDDNIKKDNNN